MNTGSHRGRPGGTVAEAGAGQGVRLRLATWNLREGRPAGSLSDDLSSKAIGQVVRLVNSMQVDAIALQEVDLHGHLPASRILEALSTETDLGNTASMRLSRSSFEAGDSMGIAVATRFPIESAKKYFLPNPELPVTWGDQTASSFDKGAISCVMKTAGSHIRFISVHIFPFHRFGRTAQDADMAGVWKTVSAFIEESQQPVVVAGDFNTNRRDLIPEVAGGTMCSAVGLLPTHNGSATDDIIFSQHFEQMGRPRVVDNFSDHMLCVADLALHGRP